MQIEELVLYHIDGRVRSIRFHLGKLNIITGDSKRGKSSLINIFRFLLGSNSPHFPSGPIQRTVQWVGLRVVVNGTRLFIGRPAPPQGSETNAAMLVVGAMTAPPFVDLNANTTSADLRQYLGGLLGIEENLHVPPLGNTRAPLATTFAHSLYYCFQTQGEIANPDLLFHHQNRDFQAQAIRDTLPYFLGAQGVDELRKREELARLRRDVRSLAQRLNLVLSESESGLGVASALIAESRRAGLLPAGEMPTEMRDARSALRVALSADLTSVRPTGEARSEYDTLSAERRELLGRVRNLEDQVSSLEDFSEVDDAYVAELVEQRSRLASIGLIPSSEVASQCPVCGQELGEAESPSRGEVENALTVTVDRLRSTQRARPRIEAAREKMLAEREGVQRRLAEISETLNGLIRQAEAEQELEATLDLASWAKGRIAQYLDLFPEPPAEEVEAIQRRVEAMRRRIAELEAEVDADALRSRTNSLMQVISRRMTAHAAEVGLEHAEHGVRIDQHRLTIVADTPSGPAYMDRNEIGSGMNWVGYHLAAYLAMQEFFISRARPVPSFLVLDQPSQAFFPRDREEGGDLDQLSDTDRANTLKLYQLMYHVVAAMDGGLQILALDHADFSEDWFRHSVIERWRGDVALIPLEWLS